MKRFLGFCFLVLVSSCSGDSSDDPADICKSHLTEPDGAGDSCEFGSDSCVSVSCPCDDGSTVESSSCLNGFCADRATNCEQACEGKYLCAVSCSDGAQNGDETGIDCGGSCEPCASLNNVNNVNNTSPTCDDGVQNGDETGTDCGGSCDACATAMKSCKIAVICDQYRTEQACTDAAGCGFATSQCAQFCEQYDPQSAQYVNCKATSGNIECRQTDVGSEAECTDAGCVWIADCIIEDDCTVYGEANCDDQAACQWR